MIKERAQIKQLAKESFKSYWGTSVGVYVVVMLVLIAGSGITMGIGSLLLIPPMMVGMAFFFADLYRGGRPPFESLFSSGFNNYGRVLGGVLWMELFVFLWSLLFVIPGIVKAYAYSFVPYLLNDFPQLSPTAALKISMRMTNGHKGRLFVMDLSFIGWALLGALTCGILDILYVGPYYGSAVAGQYDEIKNAALANGVVSLDELQ